MCLCLSTSVCFLVRLSLSAYFAYAFIKCQSQGVIILPELRTANCFIIIIINNNESGYIHRTPRRHRPDTQYSRFLEIDASEHLLFHAVTQKKMKEKESYTFRRHKSDGYIGYIRVVIADFPFRSVCDQCIHAVVIDASNLLASQTYSGHGLPTRCLWYTIGIKCEWKTTRYLLLRNYTFVSAAIVSARTLCTYL